MSAAKAARRALRFVSLFNNNLLLIDPVSRSSKTMPMPVTLADFL
jgi:hypothetical protein